ncbi:MAG: PorT family protein [Prevotellaceae bacterium]|jgi:hypothetical protein|nr:PorT family protein [Prevotellaceae bacterium]
MKRFFLIYFLVLLAAAPLYGQFSLGAKAGVSLAHLQQQQQEEETYGWSNSYHAGVAFNVYLANFSFGGFAVQPEATYNRKGRDGLYLNYVEVPLGLIYLLNFGSVIPYVSLTPYYAFLLSMKNGRQQGGSGQSFAKNDYGVKLGGGIELQRFQISASYAWGMCNIARDSNTALYNISTEISLGYFFLQ